jgi:hypothetical protein
MRMAVLATIDLAYIHFNASIPGDEHAMKQFQMRLLESFALGCKLYGEQQFVEAANSRFAFDFDYSLAVERAISIHGWTATADAARYAVLQMMDIEGPELQPPLLLALAATQLDNFADAFWEAEIDAHSMCDLGPLDLFAMGMDGWQAEAYLLYVRQPHGVWPVGWVHAEDNQGGNSDTDSDTDSDADSDADSDTDSVWSTGDLA